MRKFLQLTVWLVIAFVFALVARAFAEDLNGSLIQQLTDHTERLYSHQLQKGMSEDLTLDALGGVQDDSWAPKSAEEDTRLAYSSGRRTVKCESQANRYNYCYTKTTGRVRLDRQLSNTPCRRYDTWGADGDGSGIWVRNGCRAIFVVEGGWGGGGGGGGGGGKGGRTITCRSQNWQYKHCSANTRGRHVRVRRQISGTRCNRGDNWGTDRGGIWVDRGCAAEFSIE